jgi:ornithine cyclodeaminase/alanine dehydrogenase-like protein (mu-crystallin family)
MHALGVVRSAKVYSPTEANREKLAADFRREHGMRVAAVGSARDAVEDCRIVLAAVKSRPYRGSSLM